MSVSIKLTAQDRADLEQCLVYIKIVGENRDYDRRIIQVVLDDNEVELHAHKNVQDWCNTLKRLAYARGLSQNNREPT